ncbi:hypothetical protein Ae201684_004769 [Aphanomyces euteiches]|uniref:glucan endo-1,3-beta-D-glucosidase n=2 Tax=Aphanomyces euteiches TaxID=100861 RepID=A0A6G0XHG9_9STRA|nr:hypothetical protein Ae201684_004769 [Aphanomyces euteiches]
MDKTLTLYGTGSSVWSDIHHPFGNSSFFKLPPCPSAVSQLQVMQVVRFAFAALISLYTVGAQNTPSPALGACYSPFHLAEYPLTGPGSAEAVPTGIEADFAQMAKLKFTQVRTYYSSYFGHDIAPLAAKHGLQLHLGVYMTYELWYQNQVDSAVKAVKAHPKTIKAILVGNENVAPYGRYAADDIVAKMKVIRDRIKNETGLSVPVGTVQRVAEWLLDDPKIKKLAANSDILGVNLYPFFDNSFDPTKPAAVLDSVWSVLTQRYPLSKLRITETGWPSGGSPPSFAPKNVPNLANAKLYYKTFLAWMASKGRQGDFWYNMYDSRPDEKLPADVEYHFGLLTHKRDVKGVLKLDTSVQNDATLDRQFNGPNVLLVNSTLNLTIGTNQSVAASETIVFPPSSRASDGDNTPSMNQAYDNDEILLPSSEQF